MAEWIKYHGNKISEGEILAAAEILSGEHKYIAFFTNKKICGGICESGKFTPDISDIGYLLELRIFNCEREFRAVRTQLGKNFRWRIADEEGVDEELYIHETQLLDIDTKRTNFEKNSDGVTTFRATGGGEYTIPAESDCDSIELVNYVKYDNYGNMQFVDFRLKRFFKGGSK